MTMRLTTMNEQTPQTGTPSSGAPGTPRKGDKAGRRDRPTPAWLAPVAIGLLGIAAIAGLALLAGRQSLEPTPAAPQSSAPINVPGSVSGTTTAAGASGSTPASGTTAPQAAAAPGFDTVRVDAGGNAVIAGTAAPGATVTITASGRTLGTVKADKAGQFAFVTTTPLPPGAAQIALSEGLADGSVKKSGRSVAISVPERPEQGALAVLSGTGSTPSQVLSGQGPKPGTLGVSSVDYNASGHAVIAGTAPPGSHVRLLLGGTAVGTARTDHNGRWRISTDSLPSTPGTFTVETVQRNGKAGQSMRTAYAPRRVAALPPGQIVVRRGECLWLIARRAYGKGIDYTLIYRANEATISNPDLIYPGQTLSVPKPGGVRG